MWSCQGKGSLQNKCLVLEMTHPPPLPFEATAKINQFLSGGASLTAILFRRYLKSYSLVSNVYHEQCCSGATMLNCEQSESEQSPMRASQ